MSQNNPATFRTSLATVSARRSLILMSAGAIIGLLLSGYALFTARGTSTLFVPPEDVALVNQQPISRVDFLAQLQALYGVDLRGSTLEQRTKVLNDMIREELFVQRGKELDVATYDPEVRSAMVNAVELEIAADAITSQPDDTKLHDFYRAHPADYESEGIMTVEDYVCVKPFSPSDCKPGPTRTGETYYFAAKIHLGDRLFNAARELVDGQTSAPLEMADGVHVLHMVKNVKPVPRDFLMVRNQVLSDFRKSAIERLRVGDEGYLRRRANILIAADMHP